MPDDASKRQAIESKNINFCSCTTGLR